MRNRIILAWVVAALLGVAQPARADATAFIGATTTPANRQARGFAIGIGLIIVGFEFEYASTEEDAIERAPSLRTGMGNVLVQTPSLVSPIQVYGTVGAGLYRERLDARQETSVGINTGGGVKLTLAGPLRLRVDYRVFNLRGDPLHSRVHRVYAGLNLAF